jgi:hypothetical protein
VTTFLLGFLGVGIGWAIAGVPLSWFAIKAGRKQPERAKVRAIPFSIAIGAWTGLVVGGVGFVWAASIPDESAGAIAMMLLTIGFLAGFPLGGVVSWVMITRRVKQ